jgi:hypothetical protein
MDQSPVEYFFAVRLFLPGGLCGGYALVWGDEIRKDYDVFGGD